MDQQTIPTVHDHGHGKSQELRIMKPITSKANQGIVQRLIDLDKENDKLRRRVKALTTILKKKNMEINGLRSRLNR